MATEDEILQALTDRVIDAVQRHLDWYFGEPREAVEVLNGGGLRALWLRQYIAEGTPTVEYRTGVGDTWTAVDSDDWEFSAGQRVLFHVGIWTVGVRNYRVSYREGFATMPGDVEQFILDAVAAKWASRGKDPRIQSETLDYYSYTLADLEKVPGWAELKAHWKRGRI